MVQLAQLLNTTLQALLQIMEDDVLGRLMDEVADEETLEGEQAWAFYQELLLDIER